MFLFFSTWHYKNLLGTPEESICDSGIQFTSKENKEFADKWGFTLTTSSPHYPIQIIKKFFNRCDEDGTNHQLALQKLRTSPLDSSTQQSFSMADRWKQLCQLSSNLHTAMKQSEHPCNQGKTSAGMMLRPRRDSISYLLNQFEYKTPPATDGVKVWLSPKLRYPDHILLRCHNVNMEGIWYT